MLLGPETRWVPIDDRSFDVSLGDRGRTVTARVTLDERGAPVDFVTEDRYCQPPDDPKRWRRARWRTPIDGWQSVDGRQLPTAGRAIWELPSGPFCYVEIRPVPTGLAFNVPAGQ